MMNTKTISCSNMISFVFLSVKGRKPLPIHQRLDSLIKEGICEKLLKSKPWKGLALWFNG